MADKVPAIIKWLRGQDVLGYSQFTIDWVQDTISRYDQMAQENELPTDDEANGGIKYQVENILQVLNPRLLDADFFKQVLEQVN